MDPTTNEKYIPYCVEPSVGVERAGAGLPVRRVRRGGAGGRRRAHGAAPASGAGALQGGRAAPAEEQAGRQGRARSTRSCPRISWCDYDETGSIGKRYRRQDEIGTPFCICVDFDTEATGNVTVRDRDTMQQERVKVDDLEAYIAQRVKFLEIVSPFSGAVRFLTSFHRPFSRNRTYEFRRENAAGLSNLRGTAL